MLYSSTPNTSENPAISPNKISAQNLEATLDYIIAGEQVELFDESLVTNTRVVIGAITSGDGFKEELGLLKAVVTKSFEQNNIKFNKREGDRLKGKTEILETLHKESLDSIKRTGLYLGTIRNYFKGNEQVAGTNGCTLDVPPIRIKEALDFAVNYSRF